MTPECPIAELCQALAVARRGYHAWTARRPGPRAKANAVLLPLIEQAHMPGRSEYGSPRVVRRRRARAAIFEWIENFYNRG